MVLRLSYQAYCVAAIVVLSATLNPLTAANAGVFDDVGYTQLKNELGSATPTGTGIGVSHIEMTDTGNYKPSTAETYFTGKTFTLKSGASGISNHATAVGRYFYGNDRMAKGITDIHCWRIHDAADDWIGDDFLRLGSAAAPETETQKIQNHSWAANFGTTPGEIAAAVETLKRFDYMIQRDNVVAVVGQNNYDGNPLPHLLGQSYNSISVGRTDGWHSYGYTTINGTGRIKPEIVAPEGYVSWATPIVSSAAALLLDKANDSTALSNAKHSETVKAILMAGATKDEFTNWDRTTTRPLDDRYGAGELNIYRSYHILRDGEKNASSSETVAIQGWDFNTTSSENDYYFFDVVEGHELVELSAILTWNCTFSNDNWNGNGPDVVLANLDLKLYKANGFVLGDLLDSSVSLVDNVEHIFWTGEDGLAAGRYAFEVVSPGAGTDYALAWYSAVPEPSEAAMLLTLVGMCLVTLIWRHRKRLCYVKVQRR